MRVFVAVDIDDKNILERINLMQKSVSFKAKPIRIDQIHFTLQFLGEIGEERCGQVKRILKKLQFSQFELSLKDVGAFPNFRNPRVVWIGCDEKGGEKLLKIANEIGNNLTSLGFEKPNKFKPHLTVFRVKHKIGDISSNMKEISNTNFGTQTVSRIKLKKSVLSPKGPEYSDLLEVNGNEK